MRRLPSEWPFQAMDDLTPPPQVILWATSLKSRDVRSDEIGVGPPDSELTPPLRASPTPRAASESIERDTNCVSKTIRCINNYPPLRATPPPPAGRFRARAPSDAPGTECALLPGESTFTGFAISPENLMYTSPRSNRNRDAVLSNHISLVRTIARRLAHRLPPSVEVDELVSIGTLGLMDAWDRFDEQRGVTFKSYAEMRIKGQMIDSLRRNDWVPRSARKKNENLEHTRAALHRSLGRRPTRAEMCDALGMTPTTYEAYCADATIRPLTSLDEPMGDTTTVRLVDRVAGEEDTAAELLARRELRSEVALAVSNLPEKERVAVTLSYLEHMTLKQIGARLGVTESRACQLRSQGVKRLRYRLRSVSST